MTTEPLRKPWWSPEVLAAEEALARNRITPDDLNFRSDFGCYRALQLGIDPELCLLNEHNAFRRSEVSGLCRDYRNVLKAVRQRVPTKIADIGCGVGYTTDGLKRIWRDATVHGYDIAHDAVELAQRAWRGCEFFAGAVSPGQSLKAQYDLVLCQEFYPFTRTSCAMTHRVWITFLLSQLSDGGVLLVAVPSNCTESVNDSFAEIQSDYSIRRFVLTGPRLSRLIPLSWSVAIGRTLGQLKSPRGRTVYVIRS